MVQRHAERAQMTLDELHQHYLTTHAKVHKRRWQEDEEQFNRYMTGWKSRKMNSIQRADVQALHAKIGRTTASACKSTHRVVAQDFNIAADFGIEKNPAHGIKKFRETSRSSSAPRKCRAC